MSSPLFRTAVGNQSESEKSMMYTKSNLSINNLFKIVFIILFFFCLYYLYLESLGCYIGLKVDENIFTYLLAFKILAEIQLNKW